MKRNIVQILGVMGLVAITGCATWQPKVAVSDYTCYQASSPIVIDGKLDEEAWEQAELIDKFYIYQPEDAENLSGTKARLTWDENNLYVAIECDDDDIWSYSKKADAELWRGDVAEFFVKPSTSELSYCEFVMAPNGALYDARYPSRGSGTFWRFKDWSSKAKVKSTINGSDNNWKDSDIGYVVEMAIPFSAFSDITKKPVAGDTWTFGIFRYDYSKSFEDKLLMMSIPESEKAGFHYYEGYMPLIFAPKK